MAKTLEAGPELDARVAVDVMGYRQFTYAEPWPCGKPHVAWVAPDGRIINCRDWAPSIYWSAAGGVAEHQSRQEKCHFCLQHFTASTGTENEWRADFGFNSAHASTAPLAICLAAREAVRKGKR